MLALVLTTVVVTTTADAMTTVVVTTTVVVDATMDAVVKNVAGGNSGKIKIAATNATIAVINRIE